MRAVGWPERDTLSIVRYDVERFPFREWFCSILGSADLEGMHVPLGVTAENYREQVARFQGECDDRAPLLKATIDLFFAEVIEPLYGAIVSRQPNPTFRSHFAVPGDGLEDEAADFIRMDNRAFLQKHYFDAYQPGIFHRDRDYGLLEGTVNAWIPITDVEGRNSLWIGGRSDHGADALPVSLRYGECLFFDGACRWHGAVWNTSPTTRISFDVRFIPARHLQREARTT
jgi:hypothetical protein